MFAVIYRSYLKPNSEEVYKDNWRIIANYFVKERGALGSTLLKAEEGYWLAFSKWPDKKTRDASWPQKIEDINIELPIDIIEAIFLLKQCLDTQLPEICMEIVEEIN